MKIGNLTFEHGVFLAPMAGVTDAVYRQICRENGAEMVFSEMVSCKGLYYEDKKSEQMLHIEEGERPVALQIFGNDEKIMSYVVSKYLNKRDDIDVIDINMGCPAPKIVNNGNGSALMKSPESVSKIVREVVNASNKPVTVKMRKGWDDDNINAIEIAKIAESEGAQAVTIHGRTREEFYTGKADWDIIRRVKDELSIPVIGNGDIFEAEDALKMFQYTGCDGVMIGRGCQGNPWIFNEIKDYLKSGDVPKKPEPFERLEMALEHMRRLIPYKGEYRSIREMRKHIGWYVKGIRHSTEIRRQINTLETYEEVEIYLKSMINKLI
ncbi:MAG: tRNA dihydrouridine synthase DusB [Tissierellales bacterium]|jgi:tRNA-dihydrouridine synthase B|nr:tRNA dihydrouridine synthase DusB [Tissierellales bacterium]